MSKYSGGVSQHTVSEDMRIRFTRQLHKLRDDSVTEVVFSSDLTNIERKFLHKLAEELGLKSKSHGKADDRKITVTKPSILNDDKNDINLSTYNLKKKSLEILNPFTNIDIKEISKNIPMPLNNLAYSKPSSLKSDEIILKNAYQKAQNERMNKPGYEMNKKKRASLPAHEYKDAVNKLIKEEQIVLVSGETGCGKTTQVPQFVLDDPEIGPSCRIVVTQPRRLSAISVAERIASERGEQIGGTIGYNIRLESEKCRTTQVLFVTPGVLLRKLQSDPLLEEFSHIIIDEAHERDRFTEFLLIVLRSVCAQRKSLKLLLMSATMQTRASVFPVQEFFLEHVLRFTDYVAVSPTTGNDGGSSTNNKIVSYLRNSQVYTCSMCQSGPFKSPEELGTHCAMCDGTTKHIVHSNSNSSSNNSNNYNNKRSHTTADEIVRMLTASLSTCTSTSEDSYDIFNANNDQKWFKADTSILEKTDKKKKKSEIDTKNEENNENVDEDEINDVNDDDNVWEDMKENNANDEEEGEEERKPSSTAVISVDVKDNSNIIRDEDDDGSAALLKQYQIDFDDTQVDYNLTVALLDYIFESEFCKYGSVLVFLPGWDDISRLHRILSSHPVYSNSNIYKLIQLHSGIPRKSQSEVFEPLGINEHKIILSTNIAETSITIDDVAVVIDSGRLKEKSYDPHVKLAYLKSTWISQASARQRKGRAGRTRAGVCFHLFSKRRHFSLQEFQDSEILRMPLEELVLQAKQLGLAPGHGEAPDSVTAFLQKALDPPHELSITNAVTLLQSINCLDELERVTVIGKAVSLLPLDPRIGRIILLACIFGCGPSILTTSTAMSYRDPFIMPSTDQQRAASNLAKMRLTNGCYSDQIALLNAIDSYSRMSYKNSSNFCDEYNLSKSTMMYIKDLIQQLAQTLKESNISPYLSYSKRNNNDMKLNMSIISIGLYPDVAVRNKGDKQFTTEKGRKAKIHPGSVNSKNIQYTTPCTESMDMIGYQDLVASASNIVGSATLSMLNTTPISIYSVLLTCGVIKEVKEGKERLNDSENNDTTDSVMSSNNSSNKDNSISNNSDNIANNNSDVVLEIDSWLRLKTSRSVLNLVLSCRNIVAYSMEMFLSLPDAPLPVSVASYIDAIGKALAYEQPSQVSNSSARSNTSNTNRSSGNSSSNYSSNINNYNINSGNSSSKSYHTNSNCTNDSNNSQGRGGGRYDNYLKIVINTGRVNG